MRRVFFWLHLSVGCVIAAVVLLMSVTGVLLTYERQMIARAERGAFRVERQKQRAPLEQLLRQASAAHGSAPSGVTVFADPSEPIALQFGRQTVYVDPATGRELGSAAPGTRAFFSSLRSWHRWVGMSGASQATGKAITGASNLAFGFLALSGLYLWFPRTWTRRAFGAVAWFRGGLNGKARDFNWHNVIGFWCAVPLLLIILSGSVISYPWASALVFQLAGEKPPARQSPPKPARGEPKLDGIDAALSAAQRAVPRWREISFNPPPAGSAAITMNVNQGTGGQPHLLSSIEVDTVSGAVAKQTHFSDRSAGTRARSLLRFIHTGEAGGLAGQTLAGIVTLGAVFLVYTGIALSVRRFLNWRKRRGRTLQPEEASTRA